MRKILISVGALILAAAAGFALRGSPLFSWPVTVTSLSPDEAWRVALVERPAFLDRNFDLRLEDLRSGQVRTVLTSGDEGRPIGSERIVWSTDSSRFLLLGRRFYLPSSARLASGEQLYLMMDVRSGQMWSNSEMQRRLPRFNVEELRALKWLGWTPG